MKKILFPLLVALTFSFKVNAQMADFPTYSNKTHSQEEQPFADLSQKIWDLMAAKDAESLKAIFHPNCMFVHMGGYWGTEQELQTIGSGMIWYKHAEVYGVDVKIVNATTVAVYSTIVLDAEVGGQTTSHPFFVSQIFLNEDGDWKLSSFVFTTRMMGPGMERPDGPRPDGARPDGPRPNGPRPDGARPDGPRPNGPRPDGARPDGPRPNGPRPDGARPDGPRPNGPRPDGARPDGPRPGSAMR